LHINGLDGSLNDQVVYIDAARHLTHERRLTTGIVYPSTLLQQYSRNFMYMPGHPLTIAASLGILGDGVIQSEVPAILAYLLSIVLTYSIGSKIANRRVGVIASVLFAAFPLNIVYAASSMAEMTFVCAGLVSFALLLRLPSILRPWFGPLLLVLPFVFRETGALWIIPFGAIILVQSQRRWKYYELVLFALVSLAVLSFTFQLSWMTDRPSLLLQNLSANTFAEKYSDAFADITLPGSIAEWIHELELRGRENTEILWNLLTEWPLWLESAVLHSLLWLPVAALGFWKLLRPIRVHVVSCLLMWLTLIAFLTMVYRWDGFSGVRLLLILVPLEAIIVAFAMERLCPRNFGLGAMLGTLMVVSGASLVIVGRSVTAYDELTSRYSRISTVLGRINRESGGALIAPFQFGLVYVYENFPAVWSFVPANSETLLLLHQRHRVSMALLDRRHVDQLGEDSLMKLGLRRKGKIGGAVVYTDVAGQSDFDYLAPIRQ
jgi:4-amino-4-deoxy-L-arabinose transferase-like glycosyltransferase